MPPERVPQEAALEYQLKAIAGGEPASSFFELRPYDRITGTIVTDARTWVGVNEIPKAMRLVGEHADQWETYIGAAPRIHERGKAEDVERVWTLWADLDGRESLERLRDFHPLPAIVVRSGSEDSAHAYWPLSEPLPSRWAQRANRRIALALGADPASTDPARILRPCKSWNRKHDPPRPVVCTRLKETAFTWIAVAGSLPDDRRYVAPPRPAGEHRIGGSPERLLEGLVGVVAEAQHGDRNNKLNWAAYRAGEHIARGELDAEVARVELCHAATHVGLPETETENTIASGLAAGRRTP